jgi:hypothetical protein
VKSKLENELGYATLEMNDNVVGLLRQLKQMVFAPGGLQHPFWTLQIVMQRLLAINQGPPHRDGMAGGSLVSFIMSDGAAVGAVVTGMDVGCALIIIMEGAALGAVVMHIALAVDLTSWSYSNPKLIS